RGIAKSNAQITIKQNGYTIYQTYVSNSEGKTANGSASMDYKGAFADARVGYNYSDNGSQQQLNYALSGSL
ncbi:fimbria/pilus outer membrane usher protein, partial [Escherichia coli]|nr:fimbria/pilus outer membrane usher protein [Escherichia coli]